jgi:hypothetical protein
MKIRLLIELLRKVVLGKLIRGLVRRFLEIMFIVITLGIIKGIKKIEIFRSKKRARKKFLRILKLECQAYQSV